ncbi:hypothetical protein HDV00_006361 [Rhizophlyctis rosea]|nr:hypothetical protein HDV00_006361 [Rhizophlyctis rosea]
MSMPNMNPKPSQESTPLIESPSTKVTKSTTPADEIDVCPCTPEIFISIIFSLIGAAQFACLYYYSNFFIRVLLAFFVGPSLFSICAALGAIECEDEKTPHPTPKETKEWIRDFPGYRHFYAFLTMGMLVLHSLNPSPHIKLTDFNLNQTNLTINALAAISFCSHPHIDLQSAQPVNWTLTRTLLTIDPIPLYTDFRVILFCGDSRTVKASDTYINDGQSVVPTESIENLPVAVPPELQRGVPRHRLTVGVPDSNPYCGVRSIDIVPWVVGVLMVVKFMGRKCIMRGPGRGNVHGLWKGEVTCRKKQFRCHGYDRTTFCDL